jgi:hypothetical protein
MYSKSVFPTCLLPKKQYALFHMTKIASCPKIQQQKKNKEHRASSEYKFDAAHLRNSSTEGCGKAAPGKANNAVLSNERICMYVCMSSETRVIRTHHATVFNVSITHTAQALSA